MLRRLLIGVLIAYLLLCGARFVLQRQLQYRPGITSLDPRHDARSAWQALKEQRVAIVRGKL